MAEYRKLLLHLVKTNEDVDGLGTVEIMRENDGKVLVIRIFL